MTEKKSAHIAGALYLIIIVCGIFSEGFVRMSLFNPESAAETLNNIQTSESLFRIGLISDLIMVMADIAVAVIFYQLLKPVNQTLALLAAFFRLGQASVIGMNLLNHYSPLLLLSQAEFFSVEQTQQMTLFFMQSHKYGYLISQVFFSFNCAVMGYLLFKSPLFPKILGWGVALAALTYFLDSMVNFVVPAGANVTAMLMIVPVIVELSFCLYLLIKGVKTNG